MMLLLVSAIPGAFASRAFAAPDSLKIVSPADSAGTLSVEMLRLTALPDSMLTADTIPVYSRKQENPDFWINRIIDHDYNIKDPDILYPRFIGFCVKVYNWADRFFNTYDPDYVRGTGKKWKLMLRNDNWTDAYAMHFRPHMNVDMLSNINANIGPYIAFMAVSIGYQYNISKLMGQNVESQKSLNFNFNTALFTVDAHYSENNGGTIIRRFGDYKGGHRLHKHFADLKLLSYGIDAYYFFNNKRYSRSAAYNYSKYQLRSQGSLIAGFTVSHQSIKMDFSSLPEDMQAYLPNEVRRYNFIYTDYSFLLGYGYNWVFHPKWVYNITVMPALGFKHTFEGSVDGRDTRFSLGIRGQMAFTYNLGDWFFGANAFINGHWHINSGFYFFNSIVSWGCVAGFRF